MREATKGAREDTEGVQKGVEERSRGPLCAPVVLIYRLPEDKGLLLHDVVEQVVEDAADGLSVALLELGGGVAGRRKAGRLELLRRRGATEVPWGKQRNSSRGGDSGRVQGGRQQVRGSRRTWRMPAQVLFGSSNCSGVANLRPAWLRSHATCCREEKGGGVRDSRGGWKGKFGWELQMMEAEVSGISNGG